MMRFLHEEIGNDNKLLVDKHLIFTDGISTVSKFPDNPLDTIIAFITVCTRDRALAEIRYTREMLVRLTGDRRWYVHHLETIRTCGWGWLRAVYSWEIRACWAVTIARRHTTDKFIQHSCIFSVAILYLHRVYHQDFFGYTVDNDSEFEGEFESENEFESESEYEDDDGTPDTPGAYHVQRGVPPEVATTVRVINHFADQIEPEVAVPLKMSDMKWAAKDPATHWMVLDPIPCEATVVAHAQLHN